eukprot:gnl/TRDRNA2_/TRDRNA2_92871_c0_seq2.p1 gnl/TRDRNA2_/TRDRNA2_92871_c0~~gnl/TRDRNA2_/TRDRNA2_92871_c0_seq2.p1  ORF type:complete len:256 (-),score=28.48 gnl/TRDRNA2_/TRDRNA2_92871_c0_seq2:40-807(-)
MPCFETIRNDTGRKVTIYWVYGKFKTKPGRDSDTIELPCNTLHRVCAQYSKKLYNLPRCVELETGEEEGDAAIRSVKHDILESPERFYFDGRSRWQQERDPKGLVKAPKWSYTTATTTKVPSSGRGCNSDDEERNCKSDKRSRQGQDHESEESPPPQSLYLEDEDGRRIVDPWQEFLDERMWPRGRSPEGSRPPVSELASETPAALSESPGKYAQLVASGLVVLAYFMLVFRSARSCLLDRDRQAEPLAECPLVG